MYKKALTVSVIIPTYNEESYLRECLMSIAAQTEKPDQVIVVDNNSKDASASIAKEFKFVTLINEKKQGLYYARQAGVKAAYSDIICRIDADTFVEKHWTLSVKKLFQNQDIMAASGPVGYHDMPFPKFTQKVEDMFLRLAKKGNYGFLMGANMAFRRTAWQEIENELCNEDFIFEDIDIAIHLQNHNLNLTYDPRMLAAVSSRRLQDNPKDFMRYIGGHTRTLQHHGINAPAGAYLAEGVFTAVYFGIKPLHMSFNPESRRPSLKYFLQKKTARPDPMATN